MENLKSSYGEQHAEDVMFRLSRFQPYQDRLNILIEILNTAHLNGALTARRVDDSPEVL